MENNTDTVPWADYRRPMYIPPGAYIPAAVPQYGNAAHQEAATTAYNIPPFDIQGAVGTIPPQSSHLRSHMGDQFDHPANAGGSGSFDGSTTLHVDGEELGAATETPGLPYVAAAVVAAFQNAPDNGNGNATTPIHTPRQAAGTYVPSLSSPPTEPTPMAYNGQMFQPGAISATYGNLVAGGGYYNPPAAWPETGGPLIPSWATAPAMPSPQNHLFQGQYNAYFTPPQYTNHYGAAYATGLDAGSLNFGQGFGSLWDQHLHGGFGPLSYPNPAGATVGNPYMFPTYTAPYIPVSQPANDMGSSLQAPVSNAVAWRQPSVRSGPAGAGNQRSYGNGHDRGRAGRAVAPSTGGSIGASQRHSSPYSHTGARSSQPRPQHAAAASPGPLLSFRNVFQSEDLRRGLSSGGQSMASNDPSETGSAYSYLVSQLSEPLLPPKPRRPAGSGSGSNPASQLMSRWGSSQSAPRLIAPKDALAEQQHPGSAQCYNTPPTSNTSQGPHISLMSSNRGKRTRPLTPETKQNSNDRRGEKSVCIWCKLSGTGCHKLLTGPDFCQGCEGREMASTCIPFYFMDHVDAESTQFTARQFMGPPPPERDGSPPSTARILNHIRELARTRDIRAVVDDERLFDLDLDKSHRSLTATRSGLSSLDVVQAFVDAQAQKHSWRKCVVVGGSGSGSGPGPTVQQQQQQQQDPLRALALFDDVMPGRVSYRLVSRHNGSEEDLRPDTPANRLTLFVANLLSVTFGRQIEHAAFLSLHKRLPKHHLLGGDDLDQLAGRLFALRWRVSLCKRRLEALLFAGSARAEDPEAGELSRCMARLRDLSQKLYFCFCCIRHKRVNHPTLRNELGSDGRTHRYAGARRHVTERCPEVYSHAGFEQWMRDGDALVQLADLVEW